MGSIDAMDRGGAPAPEGIEGLSLVVPAHDEESRLPRTLAEAARALPGLARRVEIVVVDDGSSDGTAHVAASCDGLVPVRVVRLDRNRGKGAAVGAGIAAAREPFVAFTDADCPYELGSLRPMLDALARGTVDVAIGARDLPESRVSQGYGALRRLSGKVFSGLTWLAVGMPFRDSQCGLKAFRAETARALFDVRTIDGFAFDVEVLAAAIDNGLRVERFPVDLTHDDASRVRVVRDSLVMAGDLARVRRGLAMGAYRLDAAAAGAASCPLCASSRRHGRASRDGWHMVECEDCGLWYLAPMPGRARLEAYYRDSYYASECARSGGYADYESQADDLRETFRDRLALVPGAGGRLLDVGGGFGYLADAARAEGRFVDCWVVEASEAAAGRVAPSHRVVVGWFPDVELPRESFDLVSLQDCFEHLPEPRRALARIADLLRPGGRLLIVTPDTSSLLSFVQRGSWVSLKFPEHVALWNPPTLRRALVEAGLRVDRIVPAGQVVRLDFLVSRVLAPLPGLADRAARAVRACGGGDVRTWVPSGSIAVVATRPGGNLP